MMKKVFTLFTLVFAFCNAFSQNDLVVSATGDTIPCKIKFITESEIGFTYRKENGKKNNVTVAIDQIRSYKECFYCKEETQEELSKLKNYSKYSLTANVGYGKGLGTPESGLREEEKAHMNRLKNSVFFHFQGTRFFSKSYGLALSYSVSNSTSSYLIHDNFTQLDYSVEENERYSMLGASLAFRYYYNKARLVFNGNLGLSYVNYSNNYHIKETGSKESIKRNTIGYTALVGVGYRITENLSVGINADVLVSTGYKEDVMSRRGKLFARERREENENLSRIGVSAGLTYQF